MTAIEACADTHVSTTTEIAIDPPFTLPGRRTLTKGSLVFTDSIAALCAALVAMVVTQSIASLVALAWPVMCVVSGTYAGSSVQLSSARQGARRILTATVATLATLGALSYLAGAPLGQTAVIVALPVAFVVSVAGRIGVEAYGKTVAATGRGRRVIIVGREEQVRATAASLSRNSAFGSVVAGVVAELHTEDPLLTPGAPLLSGLDRITTAIELMQADTVVVTGGSLTPDELRSLAWSLEDHEVELAVLPGLVDVAGHRLSVQVNDGMPIVWVAPPCRSGVPIAIKHACDRVLAAGILALIAPVLVVVAAAIRVGSRGPAIFRQTRIGKGGQPFTLFKFRTMVVDAEDQREVLLTSNEAEGPLFKMREDPRVTRLGQFLRKHSIDELPQLLNVIRGEMSLVGPRPPLPVEVAAYDSTVRRRLLVRPGLTGLWQVSGRSDLAWEEAVRLDLAYVDNLSVGQDVEILRRTVSTVVKGAGAY